VRATPGSSARIQQLSFIGTSSLTATCSLSGHRGGFKHCWRVCHLQLETAGALSGVRAVSRSFRSGAAEHKAERMANGVTKDPEARFTFRGEPAATQLQYRLLCRFDVINPAARRSLFVVPRVTGCVKRLWSWSRVENDW
jgi:hypothetical protein